MNFEATEKVVLRMAALAVNAAVPVGLGFLHAEVKDYTDEDTRPYMGDDGLFIDYFRGRMTKLAIRRSGDGSWEMRGDPSADHQSWAGAYPTNEALLRAASEPPGSEKKPTPGDLARRTVVANGVVPPTCTMPGEMLVMIALAEAHRGRAPCDGCNTNRSECGGAPKK